MGKIITLLTDFGMQDYYVAAIKGVILSRCADARLVDISHEVPPQDVEGAAYTLSCCWREFPPGTVHLCVVDPGVGGERKPMILAADGHFFVGPDNGLFTRVIRETASWKAWEITEEKQYRRPVSSTFHGRDIFAPIAAELANGTPPGLLGLPLKEPVLIQWPELTARDGKIEAVVIHIDHFGNIVTNVRLEHFQRAKIDVNNSILMIKGSAIELFAETYSDGSHLFFIFGGSGYLEVSAANQSAARMLNVARGDKVNLAAG